jgi:hypothetical protein
MSLFDVTPAGAFLNAVQVAKEKDRKAAARLASGATSASRPRPLLALAKTLRSALTRGAKATAGLRAIEDLDSRPV